MGYRSKAVELERLVNFVQQRADSDPHYKRITVTKSVAAWIHATNRLEYAGMEVLGETEAVIRAGLPRSLDLSISEREVLQTLDLLQTTYTNNVLNHPKPANLLSVDSEKFKLYHTILMKHIMLKPGHFRQAGAETQSGGGHHKYPHHSVIKVAVNSLALMLHRLLKGLEDTLMDSIDKFLLAFAVASFAQFHFVDIHPFEDGNGRLCRFLSKRFLDWVLPFPFPMFGDRNRYIGVLVDGRALPELEGPKLLMELLLDEAIGYYKSLSGEIAPIHVLCVESEHEFNAECQRLWDSGVAAAKDPVLRNIFNALEDGGEKEVVLGSDRFVIKKFEALVYIDDI
ncbi:hypothetical protein HDU76_014002 [Blyttiomyces sp. JEL0837]|nr:hypothetical protein HDU76_014002 [Blyttiomyces sp. JEL0837]